MRSGRATQGGFTYLFLLVVLAVIAVAATASLELGTTLSQRDAEAQLLRIGAEYERALITYRLATPVGQAGRSPRSFEDLLGDRRQAGLRRHLRKIYIDPLAGNDRWGILRGSDGTIAAIYSLAPGKPIRQAGFDETWLGFNGANSYSAWCFGIDVGVVPDREVQTPCAGASGPAR